MPPGRAAAERHFRTSARRRKRTLLHGLRTSIENPNKTDDLVAATDKLQKTVMECGRTEDHAFEAATDGDAGTNGKETECKRASHPRVVDHDEFHASQSISGEWR